MAEDVLTEARRKARAKQNDPERPDSEEEEVLVGQLSAAKRTLHELLILKRYEDTPITGTRGGHKTLLAYLERGNSKRAEGAQLRDDINASTSRVEVLQAAYDYYQARHEAWVDASGTTDAEEPQEKP